jgi:uncharacterized protein YndB with AHSA1/START domain
MHTPLSHRFFPPLLGPFLATALLFAISTATAQQTGERPPKDLARADARIHWPEGMTPRDADAFVHNEIEIKAPARVIWEHLVAAPRWPEWYANSAEVHLLGPGNTEHLQADTRFVWKTFGFFVDSRVHEFVPPSRLGWYGEGTGVRAYHTWLIVEEGEGCRVVTEETQRGAPAVAFNLAQPKAMYDGHDWWLAALKARAERAARQP